MIRSIKKLFSPPAFRHEAHEAYAALVAQARKPWFFESAGVPDTLDGRFDVIVLHLFLLIHRLRRESGEEAGQFIRAVSEAFFADMDRSLREMGSSDTGVGRRVKNMAQAFYGRLQAYEQSQMQEARLKDAIARNLYRAGEIDLTRVESMTRYVLRVSEALNEQTLEDILQGNIRFSD